MGFANYCNATTSQILTKAVCTMLYMQHRWRLVPDHHLGDASTAGCASRHISHADCWFWASKRGTEAI
jgi:hypothetical protein